MQPAVFVHGISWSLAMYTPCLHRSITGLAAGCDGTAMTVARQQGERPPSGKSQLRQALRRGRPEAAIHATPMDNSISACGAASISSPVVPKRATGRYRAGLRERGALMSRNAGV